MKKIFIKITFGLLTLSCFYLFGCGEDNFGGDYSTTLSLTDAGEDGVLTLDMSRGVCSSGEPEPFTDVFANISVTVAEFASGITLNGYTIEYLPELSEDGTHTLVMPPELNSLLDMGGNLIYMPTDSTTEFTTTCFSVEQKEDYMVLIAGYTDLVHSRYTIRITLYCTDDNGQSQTIVTYRTVYFGTYDNC